MEKKVRDQAQRLIEYQSNDKKMGSSFEIVSGINNNKSANEEVFNLKKQINELKSLLSSKDEVINKLFKGNFE